MDEARYTAGGHTAGGRAAGGRSAGEDAAGGHTADGHTTMRIAHCAADVIELASFRGQAHAVAELAAARGARLPPLGQLECASGRLILAVRPERWLLLSAPAGAGALAQSWQEACTGLAAVIDHSAALSARYLTGAATREVLKRGCRLDLEPRRFPSGAAATTMIAGVPVILAAVSAGVLLLVASSLAQHFDDWLAIAARAFEVAPSGSVSVAMLSGESVS